jgi:hypothetical protein
MSRVETPSARLSPKLRQLQADFRNGSLDLPDGLIERNCVFRLNGVAYEDTLGRSSGDPLIRLLGRGPVACRFLMQQLRSRMPDAEVQIGELEHGGRESELTMTVKLTGTPRGVSDEIVASANLDLVTNARAEIVEVHVRMPADDVCALLAGGRG